MNTNIEHRETQTECPSHQVVIHTDGACIGNPGPGGYAAILQLMEGATQKLKKEIVGSDPNTTNNRMELKAVIEAIKEIKVDRPIVIRSDSQYVIKGMTEWLPNWKAEGRKGSQKKPVKNKDLWEVLDKLAGSRTITWKWVRGHSGDPLNEEVDRLANEAARMAS